MKIIENSLISPFLNEIGDIKKYEEDNNELKDQKDLKNESNEDNQKLIKNSSNMQTKLNKNRQENE